MDPRHDDDRPKQVPERRMPIFAAIENERQAIHDPEAFNTTGQPQVGLPSLYKYP